MNSNGRATNNHTSHAPGAASHFLQALKDLLTTNTDAFSDNDLTSYAVCYQSGSPKPCSQRIARPSQQEMCDMVTASPVHPSECIHLQPPPLKSQYAFISQYTSIERASQFADTLSCLLRPQPESLPTTKPSDPVGNTKQRNRAACLSDPETNDAWQDFLYTGEQAYPDEWRTLWRMVKQLEAGDFTSCITADSANAPPGTLLRSELACLLTLVGRQLSRLGASRLDKPDDWDIAVVVTTFTPDTVRVLQASLVCDSSPRIHVSKPFDKPITQVTGPDASTEWRELVSWMCAAPAAAAAPEPIDDILRILKHREATSTVLGGSDSSRSVSGSSTFSREAAP